MVVRDAERRRQVADLVIDGGATYFSIMRPKKDGVTDEEHAQWGRDYAEQILATYRIAPVWLIGLLVPRNNYPERMQAGGASGRPDLRVVRVREPDAGGARRGPRHRPDDGVSAVREGPAARDLRSTGRRRPGHRLAARLPASVARRPRTCAPVLAVAHAIGIEAQHFVHQIARLLQIPGVLEPRGGVVQLLDPFAQSHSR